jgi:hypothetical protein
MVMQETIKGPFVWLPFLGAYYKIKYFDKMNFDTVQVLGPHWNTQYPNVDHDVVNEYFAEKVWDAIPSGNRGT